MSDFTPGAFFEFAYPFVRADFETFDADGPATVKTWNPGVRFETRRISTEVADCDNVDTVYDDLGAQIVTIISIHKPGKYPTRIFYTREWKTPDGKVFGRKSLKSATIQTFRRLIAGYRHEAEKAGT